MAAYVAVSLGKMPRGVVLGQRVGLYLPAL